MMKKFIRQKNRNNKAMGMMLLVAVLFLSVFYAALYSVIYMFGSGSVEVESGNLYYKVSKDSNEQSDGGKFYKSCDEEGNVSSDTGLTTMSAAMKAMSGGGNIYMLSSYEPKSSDETVTVPQKSVTIQRFIKVDNGVEQASFEGPLFDIKKDFKIEVSNDGTQFAISGSKFQCASGAFVVSNNAVLTLNNSTSGLNPGVFIIDNNYCSSNGGAINLTKGSSLVANSIQFKNNRCVNASGGVCGGAICSQESKIDISNCKFTENTVKGKSSGTSGFGGGAVYIGNGSSGVMKNCEVTGNKSYFSSRAGAGVYVEASENSFALSGSTIIKDNTCCYSAENTQSDLSVNDNLHLRGGIDNSNNNANISINTSGLLEGSEILVNTNPSLSENDDLRALISDSGYKASSIEYFKSDIKGYKPAIESSALYLVFSPEYDELWYGEKTVKGSDGSTSTYKSFFSDENLANDTGFTHLRDAVGIIKTNGKIHMLTSYVSSVDETVNVPKAKVVNIVRESTFKSDSMFKITGGTFTVNATDPNSSIIFDGQNIETSVKNGGAFYVKGGSINLNGAEKTGENQKEKTIVVKNNIVSTASSTAYGSGIYMYDGTNTLTNCSITGNTASSYRASGGGVYINSGTNTLTNCSITGNTASASSYVYGGGIDLGSGTNTLENCSITGNTASSSSSYVYGGGIGLGSGTNTLENCSITGNTASSSSNVYGGGVRIGGGTNTLTNCSMTGNTASSSGDAYGGGFCGKGGTNTLESCSITGNTVSSDFGGGVYMQYYNGTFTLLGTMNITGNTANSSTSNLYLVDRVILTDRNGKALSTGSKIGVKTSSSPTEGKSVQFATGATEDMKLCFTPDEAGIGVYYENGGLYLEYIYDTIYQKGNAFYTDEACSNAISGVTTLARAVEIAQEIVFVGNYKVTSDETVTIPAGRTVTLLRYANFKDISMLDLSGGSFTLNAPSASSKLIMDGNNVDTTEAKGAMIYINNDANNKFVLKGCSESNRNIEVKNFFTTMSGGDGGAICNVGGGTINIQNCKFTSNYAKNGQGGAIYSSGGSEESVIKNCEFSDNHALNGHDGGAVNIAGGIHNISNCNFHDNTAPGLHAGGLHASAGTNTIENCTFERNKAKWGGAIAFEGDGTNNITNCVMRNNATTGSGGAVDDYNGVNTYTNCTIEKNTCDSAEGGGFCVNNQRVNGSNIIFAGKMTIINNTANGAICNAYCVTGKIMVLANNFSTESKIGVTVQSTDYPVMFAMGATEAMKKCFSTDETDKAILYYGSGRLYITKAYDTIYQKDHFFYTDEACSNTISNITTLEIAVEVAKTIVFVGSYTAKPNETVTIPADKTVTFLRYANFKDISMLGLSGGTLTLAAPDPNSKLIIDGNNIETTGAKGSMIYIDSNSSNKLVLKGCSESNQNIEVKNCRTAMKTADYGSGNGDGGAICNLGVGAVDAQNCKFTGNYSNYGKGGAIYGGAGGTINIQNCTFTGNYTKNNRGGAICSYGSSTESTIKNCEFSDNHALNGSAGGTISIEEGTHTISNCNFHDNASESASAGGIFVYGGTNRIESCTFKNNSAQWGGAVAIEAGTNVMKDCTITGNTASTFGGGIYISNGTNALTGVMTITDNVCPKGKNLYLYASRVFSLKDGSTSLSEGSNIGITTEVAPAENAPVQFAESATESMKALFTADKANSEVIYQNGKLYLGYTFNSYFYKDGTFYTDEECTNSTGISKLSDLISKIQIQNSRIYMMSCYNSSGNETTYVPSNKNITVLRHGSFTNNSMFSVTGGTFTVDATDPTSSITFDGNGIGVSINAGGAFKVNGGSINLSGAEKSSGGKTITVQNNNIAYGSSILGGGIYMHDGTNTLKNCSITANKLTAGAGSSLNSAYGGGIYVDNGAISTLENCDITNNTVYAASSGAHGGGAYIGGETNTLTNCNITGNTVSSSTYYAFGGGLYIWSGKNTLENCDITANTAYSLYGVYGGGVYLSKSSTLLGKINITSNTAEVSSTSSDNNLYFENKYTVTLKSGSKSLSSGSKIGVMTDTAPTASAPVQFAESATSEMVDYFTPDNDTYYVDYENDGLYLKVPSVMYSDLYYKNDVFYSDPSCTATTGMTKLADAVVCMKDGGTIHMLSSYVVDRGSQTVAVPKDRSINIVRDGSFSSGVMFNVPGGSLSVKVPDTTKSKLTISGEDIDIGSQTGEAFTVSGSGSLTLEGASSINRNLVIKKHKATSCAMNLDSGSCLMKNCFFTENTATGTSGGGIYTLNCKTIFDGCKISGNRCNGNGSNYYLPPAGILVARSGTTTLVGDMEVLDNYNTYDNSQANLEILFSGTSPIDYYSIALSYTDSNGVTHKLTSGEGLVRTCSVSILMATRIFATGATADMVKCFVHDTNSSYQFKIDGTDIYMYVTK